MIVGYREANYPVPGGTVSRDSHMPRVSGIIQLLVALHMRCTGAFEPWHPRYARLGLGTGNNQERSAAVEFVEPRLV